ncbi:MAG: DnaA regulatory inactivator Hda, partial [Rhodoferax sp.]|nr:DnaA regulatory inactivator Hda [Rhodoferax sp.]
MRQIALDIGVSEGPTLANFLPGPNQGAWQHLRLWLGSGQGQPNRSPVPTYLWGPAGSGKTHLLKALRTALHGAGEPVGWLDAATHDPGPFDESWAAVLLDDVHLYTAAQQQRAFNWFVQAQAQQRAVLAAGALAPAGLALRE